MFNLFKKKETAQPTEVASAVVNELDNEIVVHVMPAHFRQAHADASQAKMTGMLILIGGLLFLLALSGGLYYFLFKYKPQSKPETIQNQDAGKSQITSSSTAPAVTIEQPIATSTEPISSENLASSTEVLATSTASSTEVIEGEVDPIVYTMAEDSDSDLLTDAEESIIGTNNLTQDSDADGFNDLAEFNNLYNPAGAGKLEANQRIKKYTGQSFSLLYPTVWSEKASGDFAVMFTAADNQMVQISVEPNQSGEDITSWYKQQFDLSVVPASQRLEKRDSGGNLIWDGVINEDSLTIYLTDAQKKNIYTLNYNLGLGTVITYPNILKLVANSLVFTK